MLEADSGRIDLASGISGLTTGLLNHAYTANVVMVISGTLMGN